MNKKHLLELQRQEANYWWHVNRRQLVIQFLANYDLSKTNVLEVGCGGGLLSSLLIQAGANVVAADILMDAVKSAIAKDVENSLVFDANKSLPFREHSFQIVIMLDVLEHIKNDVDCLYEIKRILKKGGIVILTVPAHQFLFSSWDKVLGHYRRYSKSWCRVTFKNIGFQPVLISYHNALSFLPALILRGKDKLFRYQRQWAKFPDIPDALNKFLKWWGRVECKLVYSYLPIGLSFFIVLKTD